MKVNIYLGTPGLEKRHICKCGSDVFEKQPDGFTYWCKDCDILWTGVPAYSREAILNGTS